MKNSKTLFDELTSKILPGETADEVRAIACILLEDLLGLSRTDILAGRMFELSMEQERRLTNAVERLNRHEPVQYVLGKADFFGRSFNVTPDVLIPRPETELLVEKALAFAHSSSTNNVLDIGTGSGCIAITLARELPDARVFASDISPAALDVARSNARLHDATIHFMHHDILKQDLPFEMFNIIVSNPPYVMESEKIDMKRNVRDHEPVLALYVPDDDPLIFYRSVTAKAASALVRGGLLAVEINEKFGQEVGALFSESGFKSVQTIKDLAGKDRVVAGRKA